MKDLLTAILILSILIALFSINNTPMEDTPTEGWGATEGNNGNPAPGDTPAQAQPIYPQAMDSTSPVTGEF